MCEEADKETAKALDHALIKVGALDGRKTNFYGQGTNAEGGGTNKGLSTEIQKLGCLVDDDQLCVSACSLHAHNVAIKSPTEKNIWSRVE